MSSSTFFAQGCPTCGRRLHIRVEYLGKSVVCEHCRGQFIACDPSSNRYGDSAASDELLKRADELLEDATQMLRSRTVFPG